jgi:holo-[acyl-carrier protein] synthase
VIFGVGTDVVEIGRIQGALERFGERFARRILCEPELNRFLRHRLPANWHGVWVANLPSGKPELQFTPALKQLLHEKGVTHSHVSLSDEKGVAFATVVLECEK